MMAKKKDKIEQIFKYFKIEDFNTGKAKINDATLSKILNNFIAPLENIREHYFKMPIYIRSGFRNKTYNKKIKGASKSQHLYIGEGAVDISTTPEYSKCKCLPRARDLRALRDVLIKHTKFTRIVVYSTFLHCDMADNSKHGCERALYKVGADGWQFARAL